MKHPMIILKDRPSQDRLVRALYGLGYRYGRRESVESGLDRWWAVDGIDGKISFTVVYTEGRGQVISARESSFDRMRAEGYVLMNSVDQFVSYARRVWQPVEQEMVAPAAEPPPAARVEPEWVMPPIEGLLPSPRVIRAAQHGLRLLTVNEFSLSDDSP